MKGEAAQKLTVSGSRFRGISTCSFLCKNEDTVLESVTVFQWITQRRNIIHGCNVTGFEEQVILTYYGFSSTFIQRNDVSLSSIRAIRTFYKIIITQEVEVQTYRGTGKSHLCACAKRMAPVPDQRQRGLPFPCSGSR